MTLWETARARLSIDPEADDMALAGAYSRLFERIRAAGYHTTDGAYNTSAGGWFLAGGEGDPHRAIVLSWRLGA